KICCVFSKSWTSHSEDSRTMANVETWVDDQLHALLGMTGKHVGQYVTILARKSDSSQELIQKIKDTGIMDVDDSVESFATQLWNKVPHAEVKIKPERIREQQIVELMVKNKNYKLLSDEDENYEAPSKKPKMSSKSRSKNIRKRTEIESSSESEKESVPTNQQNRSESEDEFDKMEKDRLKDLKERDEFAGRLKDKDKERQRNIAEKSDKKAFEEAAKRLKMEAEDKKKIVPKIRVESRRKYLEKRKADKLAELEGGIIDEEYLFGSSSLSKKEKVEL
ncbi:DHX16 (predicted), partial [Pycnogonum litorale]